MMLELQMPNNSENNNSNSNLTELVTSRNSSATTPTINSNFHTYEPINSQNKENSHWIYYFHKLILHISFHMTLLSILEPIFFFEYAVPMERQLFFDQLSDFTHYQHEIMESHSAQNIRNQPFYNAFIDFLNYQNAEIDTLLISMENDANTAKKENDNYNDGLEHNAYMFPVGMGSFTLLYYATIQYFYNYKNMGLQVLGEHISLMIFVAAYEFWFFTHVILKYHPFTKEGVMNFLVNCFFVRVFQYYPELSILQQNVTASCDT
tara:strand:- start:229 stop:1020 length:792 start_codon:yes stop_codon:yes gene_type:complete